jgi:hypothetical protein
MILLKFDFVIMALVLGMKIGCISEIPKMVISDSRLAGYDMTHAAYDKNRKRLWARVWGEKYLFLVLL